MKECKCKDCKFSNPEFEGNVCINRKSDMYRKYVAATCTCEASQVIKEDDMNE